jgi:uncharacterized OB-fold protein
MPGKKPVPRPDEESRAFWEACRRRELCIQRCRACSTVRFYPRSVCPECLSDDTEWIRCTGGGIVYSYTVTRQNQAPGFRETVPYILAYVELAEGIRLLTNIVDCHLDSVHIGMAVDAVFEDDSGSGMTLVKFRPATS